MRRSARAPRREHPSTPRCTHPHTRTLPRSQDNGSEHPHRCALSVHASKLHEVRGSMEHNLQARGVRAKLVTSGQGDWRYVDILAHRAGKLAALEYVRELYGVDRSRCVAAGDSGNDTLMLGGRNPAVGARVGGGGVEGRRPARCPRPGKSPGVRLVTPPRAPLPVTTPTHPRARSRGQRPAQPVGLGAAAAAGRAAGGQRRPPGARGDGRHCPPRALLTRAPMLTSQRMQHSSALTHRPPCCSALHHFAPRRLLAPLLRSPAAFCAPPLAAAPLPQLVTLPRPAN